MKKMNSKGFVLAETLIVTVFLMIIFTMLYSNFYPLIGEYEKRENYNDVNGIYAVYWLKRMIESPDYIVSNATQKNRFASHGYIRFNCSDIAANSNTQQLCVRLVKNLEVEGCDSKGDGCDIFITRYQIGYKSTDSDTEKKKHKFKNTVQNYRQTRAEEVGKTVNTYKDDCAADLCPGCTGDAQTKAENKCLKRAKQKVFPSHFQDYVNSLPNYTTPSLTNAQYRVIAVFHHTNDNNNYYSYATIEVDRK